MVLSFASARCGKRVPCQLHPSASTATDVRERSRSSEHSSERAPDRTAVRKASAISRVSNGPMGAILSNRIDCTTHQGEAMSTRNALLASMLLFLAAPAQSEDGKVV